jgi:hypothetical protein
MDGADLGPTAGPGGSGAAPPGPLAAARAFFLPQGWPGSVTDDYLHYQLWSFPTHVTGWMSSGE